MGEFLFDPNEYFEKFGKDRLKAESKANEEHVVDILQRMIDDSITLQSIEIDKLRTEISGLWHVLGVER